jgi:hypothetical protein
VVALKLIEDKKAGLDPRSFFKEFGKGNIRLEKLRKPKLLKEDDRKKFPDLTDAEWKIKRNEINHESSLHFEYQKKLKEDFFASMYKTLLKILPEIRNFSADDTIVFNHFLEDAFLVVYRFVDRLQKVISYGFDLNYYRETDEELATAISKCSKKKQAEEKEKEIRRWKGEKI